MGRYISQTRSNLDGRVKLGDGPTRKRAPSAATALYRSSSETGPSRGTKYYIGPLLEHQQLNGASCRRPTWFRPNGVIRFTVIRKLFLGQGGLSYGFGRIALFECKVIEMS